METVLVCVMAFFAAGLTLVSGFGLGTLLMPVLACFSPIEEAIAITAIVHFLNNLLKLVLLGRYADKHVVVKFGLPALLSALLGAWVLGSLVDQAPLVSYHLFNREFHVTPVKLTIAILLAMFVLLESGRQDSVVSFDRKYLPIGGFMSGFFGGLSGHQGALRSAFLIKSGLTKESFLGSGVAIACLVDLSRIAVYGVSFPSLTAEDHLMLLVAVTASAFGGTWFGNQFAQKVTIDTIRGIVSILVLGIAVGLGIGMI
ncbi:MAG TPA: TSUP family transporter [Nitrospira sp.]|nr:TSUP family transporter [Nitrospira sp.]